MVLDLKEERSLPIPWEISICNKQYLVESKSGLDAFQQVINGPNKPDSMGLIFWAREFPDGEKHWYGTEVILRELGIWSDIPPEDSKPGFISGFISNLLQKFVDRYF